MKKGDIGETIKRLSEQAEVLRTQARNKGLAFH